MLPLKDYQRKTLDALKLYFNRCVALQDGDIAFYETTKQLYERGVPYRPVAGLPGLPYVCLRVPTGGGKTLIASHSIEVAARQLLFTETPTVLWLVPSNKIREQTIEALKSNSHPYRQALTAAFGNVNVKDVAEALHTPKSVYEDGSLIIVATLQAFRVEDTDGRKVYDSSGTLLDHFSQLPAHLAEELEKSERGAVKYSLANVLRLRRPMVIVDEAHNARTDLSFDTLVRFRPSCIIEFTATPDTQHNPSNVLYSVSAAQLHAEQMIKMPIKLEVRTPWKELLGDAISLRDHLETVAVKETGQTGEYIRPIMLIQAQPNRQGQDCVTVEIVEQCLKEDFRIPAEHIAVETGQRRDLDRCPAIEDNACPVRYVITVQALREGWDCPFAYVLCSVAEMRSSTAVEQILGRVMRLPKAKRKQAAELNAAYAFVSSQSFGETAEALHDALVENGFEKRDVSDYITPLQFSPIPLDLPTDQTGIAYPQGGISGEFALEGLFEGITIQRDVVTGQITNVGDITEDDRTAALARAQTDEQRHAVETVYAISRQRAAAHSSAPADSGAVFSLPVLAIRQGDLFEPLEETHFSEVPLQLSQHVTTITPDAIMAAAEAQTGTIGLDEKGGLQIKFLEQLHREMQLMASTENWTIGELAYWIDRQIPHADISPDEAAIYLTQTLRILIEQRGLSLETLVTNKYRLCRTVAQEISRYRQQAKLIHYQSLFAAEAELLQVTPERCFTYDPHAYPYNFAYQGAYRFRRHYYKAVGDLRAEGEEFQCARFLDELPQMKFWVRNIERQPIQSFWLQTSTDKFYPDFVCLLNDGRYLVVEYKGSDRWSNDDSREKRALGEFWAARSGGKGIFVMPQGADLEAIRRAIR